jgi:thiamine-monophosphate kinase
MKLSEIGQFGMIDIIAGMIEKQRDNQQESWRQVISGIGDDCAVWQGDLANQFAKTDCQVQGIHFNLDLISWHDLGWKALAVNLSDIASKGGIPSYALVSLGLPSETEVGDVVSLYNGMLELATQSGTAIVGGNLSGSPTIFIDVHVIGKAGNPEGRYLSRSGAAAGDSIAVTGCLGNAAAGLELLRQKAEDEPAARILKEAFTHPQPRLKEGLLLVEKGVKCGMDISDGLLSDLNHICRASQVSARLYLDLLPVNSEVQRRFGPRAFDLALAGGEDYQLLFTAKSEVIKGIRECSEYPVTEIGEITALREPSILVLDQKGLEYRTENRGWDHFKHQVVK